MRRARPPPWRLQANRARPTPPPVTNGVRVVSTRRGTRRRPPAPLAARSIRQRRAVQTPPSDLGSGAPTNARPARSGRRPPPAAPPSPPARGAASTASPAMAMPSMERRAPTTSSRSRRRRAHVPRRCGAPAARRTPGHAAVHPRRRAASRVAGRHGAPSPPPPHRRRDAKRRRAPVRPAAPAPPDAPAADAMTAAMWPPPAQRPWPPTSAPASPGVPLAPADGEWRARDGDDVVDHCRARRSSGCVGRAPAPPAAAIWCRCVRCTPPRTSRYAH
eukprot:ctg_1456.g510